MRTLALVLPGVALVAILAIALFRQGSSLEPGDPAPTFTAPLLASEGELSLEDLRGKPVVLNFWASWCGPCKDEAPELAAAAAQYEGEVVFVGVNIKDARSDAIEFAERYGLDYVHVRDEDNRIYTDYGLTGQPETFFVAADGTVSEHVPGPLFEGDLELLLQRLVADG